MRRIERSAIVERSAAEFCALVEDIESYPRFLPWCRAATVRERGPERTVATLDLGFQGLRHSITTENHGRPGESIDMRLIAGPFRRFAAAWRFRPLEDRACKVEFTLEYELAGGKAGRLLEPLLEQIADTIVDAFTRRAEAVYGAHAR